MGRYNGHDEGNSSSNRARREYYNYVEELERERLRDERRDALAEEKAMMHNIAKQTERMAERTLRSNIMDDQIGREAHRQYTNIQTVGNIAMGLALLVSASATEAAYNNHVRDFQDDYNNLYDTEKSRRESVIAYEEGKTLSEYRQSLEQERAQFEATTTAYRVEFEEKRQEAHTAINSATEKLDAEKTRIFNAQNDADSQMLRDRQLYNEASEQAKENYQKQITNAEQSKQEALSGYQKSYQETVANIEKTATGAEKERLLNDAKKSYLENERTTENNFKKQVDGFSSDYQTRQAALDSGFEKSKQQYEQTTRSLTDQRVTAQTKYDDFVQQKKRTIEYANIKENEVVNKAQAKVINAEKKLNEFESNKEARASKNQRALEDVMHQEFGAKHDPGFGQAASNYKSLVLNRQTAVGYAIATQLGTKEEQAVLARVEKEKEAAKASGEQYVPSESALADINKANQIAKKYAGDLSTASSMSATIKQMNNAVEALSETQQTMAKQLLDKKKTQAEIRQNIGKLKDELNQYTKDKTALREFQNGKRVLSDAEVAKIKERIAKVGSVDNKLAELKSLQKKEKKNNKNIQELTSNANNVAATMQIIKSQIGVLNSKAGKTIPDIDKQGNSKKNKDKEKRIERCFNKSISNIHRSLTRSATKGNAISKELNSQLRSMSRLGEKYTMAVSIAETTGRILFKAGKFAANATGQTIRIIGGNTRLGRALAEQRLKLRNSKMGQRLRSPGAKKIAANAGKVTRKILYAPGKILSAPMSLKQMPMKMTKKALISGVKFTRKNAGRLGHQFSKQTRKGASFVWRHTLGRSAKMQAKLDKYRERMNAAYNFRQRAAEKLKSWAKAPFKWIASKASSIVQAIMGVLGPVISAVVGVLGSVASAFGIFFLIIIVVLIIASMLSSALGAIQGFFESLTATHDIFIKNEPEYILNCAADYRKEELRILELFSNDEQKEKISVSDDPIYYTLCGMANKSIFSSNNDYFTSDNQPALEYVNNMLSSKDNKGNATFLDKMKVQPAGGLPEIQINSNIASQLPMYIKGSVKKYNSSQISYYPASALSQNSDGTYVKVKDKNGNMDYKIDKSLRSDYEISNAKDALSIVDSLYTSKGENFQKVEVLGYLGVDGSNKTKDATQTKNLFWLTHKFVVENGDSPNDIWYHGIKRNETDKDLHVIDHTSRYRVVVDNAGNKSYVKETITDPKRCTHYDVLNFTYQVTEIVTKYRHNTAAESGDGADGEYLIQEGAIKNIKKESLSLTGNELFYYNNAGAYNYLGWNGLYNKSGKEVVNVTTKNGDKVTIEVIATNKIRIDDGLGGILNTLYHRSKNSVNGGNPGRLNFYLQNKTKYHVVDAAGVYLGVVDIKKDDVLNNMILNCQGSSVNQLEYFYLLMTNGSGGKRYYSIKMFSRPGLGYDPNTWYWPVKANNFYMTSPYGYRTHPISGEQMSFHSGVDLAWSKGTPIYASKSGTVVDTNQSTGYGINVAIEHAGGVVTRYCHLDSRKVLPGYKVSQGEVIGYMGSTGNSTGPHLHFEVRPWGIWGSSANPENYCKQFLGSYNINGSIKPTSHSKFVYEVPTLTINDNTLKLPHGCKHSYQQSVIVDKNVPVQVCQGHIDLDVGVVVSTTKDGDHIFNDAAQVEPLEEDMDKNGFLGLYVIDSKYDVNGWGSVTYNKYHPYEDFAPNSDYRGLAIVKTEMMSPYEFPPDADLSKISEKLTSNNVTYDSLKSLNNFMLFGYSFNGSVYYSPYLISGEQKEIPCYKVSDNTINKKPYLIDFNNRVNGRPSVTLKEDPKPPI